MVISKDRRTQERVRLARLKRGKAILKESRPTLQHVSQRLIRGMASLAGIDLAEPMRSIEPKAASADPTASAEPADAHGCGKTPTGK